MPEKDKRSFFERLTGTISVEEEEKGSDESEEENQPEFPEELGTLGRRRTGRYEPEEDTPTDDLILRKETLVKVVQNDEDEETDDGELAVDVYEDNENIYVQSMVAGVDPSEIDVSIKRDAVYLSGNRINPADIPEEDYYHKELYWGKFSRKIDLPEEIDPERSEALEKHGLLILRLPKLNRKPSQKLNVRSID